MKSPKVSSVLSNLVTMVFLPSLKKSDLTDEQITNLTSEEIKANGYRYCLVATDANVVISADDIESAKHTIQAKFQGIQHMDGLDAKYVGGTLYDSITFYFSESTTLPSGPAFQPE